MDTRDFCSLLKIRLHSAVYNGTARADVAPFPLLLTHGNFLLGRYALAVLPWQPGKNGAEVLRLARKEVSKHILTIPVLAQLGLYLVVMGAKAEWSRHVEEMPADRTGWHAVIVQAVLFIDVESRASVCNRSQCGRISFGGTVSVSDVIDSLLRDAGTEK